MDQGSQASGPEQAGFQVDDLIIDLGQQRVSRAGVDIPLPPLSFELLVTLARAAPNLVTFDQLTERVWTGLVITPETISQRVKLVRAALGDDPHAPRYIGGVRGRGYRMVAAVSPMAERRAARSPSPTPYWMNEKSRNPWRPGAPGRPRPAVPPPARPRARGVRVGRRHSSSSSRCSPTALGAHPLPGPRHPQCGQREVHVQPAHSIAVLPLIDTSPGRRQRLSRRRTRTGTVLAAVAHPRPARRLEHLGVRDQESRATCAPSRRRSVCATSSRAACIARAISCASRRSWSMPRPATTSGRRPTTAPGRTCSRSRMTSRARSPARSRWCSATSPPRTRRPRRRTSRPSTCISPGLRSCTGRAARRSSRRRATASGARSRWIPSSPSPTRACASATSPGMRGRATPRSFPRPRAPASRH